MSQAAGVGPLLKTATSTLELISEQCPLLAGKEDALVSEAGGLPSLGCREGVQWAARAGLPRNLESAHSNRPLAGGRWGSWLWATSPGLCSRRGIQSQTSMDLQVLI